MSTKNAETSSIKVVSPFGNAMQERLFAKYAEKAMRSDAQFFWNDFDMSETLSSEARVVSTFGNAEQENLFAKCAAESMDENASIKL